MTDSGSSPAVDTVARRAYDELMAGFLLPAVLGAIAGQRVVIAIGIASAVLGLITLAITTIARSRFESAQLQARLHLEVTRREAEGRFLHAVTAIGIDPTNVEQEIERLEKAQSAGDQEISHDHDERRKTVSGAGDAAGELLPQVGEAQRDWDSLAAGLQLPEVMRGAPGLARDIQQLEEVAVADMADGTREAANLALRIGLIRSVSQQWSPAPVLVGDILSSFDPERANEAIRALAGLASGYQVILFTCRPPAVELARSVSPGVRIITPGAQNISSPAAIWLGDD